MSTLHTTHVPPITVLATSADTGQQERSVGAILVNAGRLTSAAAEEIFREQKARNIRFGEAAIKMGLLRQDDIDFALARQFDYCYLQPGSDRLSTEIEAAFRPTSPLVEQLRSLRSQLTARWFDGNPVHKGLAIVSAQPHEGRSYIAANLAVLFSQLGMRTLLIDADLRRPRQHNLFKLRTDVGLSNVLSGRAGWEAMTRIDGMPGLSVLGAGPQPPNPQELLGRQRFSQLLAEAANEFDVTLVDTSATSISGDAQMVAARVGGAMLVARKNHTSTPALQALALMLRETRVATVGAVLNDF